MRRNTRQFRWIKNISAILNFVTSNVCYIELYEAQHPPVQMDKNQLLNDRYCLCYIELCEAQHSPIEMDINIECDLKYNDKNCL